MHEDLTYLTRNGERVYRAMRALANADGAFRVTRATLAHHIGITTRTVSRALAELEAAELIERTPRRAVYRLTTPPATTTED